MAAKWNCHLQVTWFEPQFLQWGQMEHIFTRRAELHSGTSFRTDDNLYIKGMVWRTETSTMGCNFFSVPLISASGTHVVNWWSPQFDSAYICVTHPRSISVTLPYIINCQLTKTQCTSLLPEASFGLRVLSLPASGCLTVSLCVNHWFVRAITQDPFKLGSPNVVHRCKTLWLRSLLLLMVNDHDLQGQI